MMDFQKMARKPGLITKIIGIICLIIGIAGLFLPFIQGILMIIIGLAFLEEPHAVKMWKKIKEKIHKSKKKGLKEHTSE